MSKYNEKYRENHVTWFLLLSKIIIITSQSQAYSQKMWNNLIFFQTSNSYSVLTSSLFVFEIVEL